MATPAGWYDDPQDARFIRYWDGFQWSADVAPKVAGPVGEAVSQGIDTGPSSVLHYLVPVGRSWQSVVAPYLGLFSLISLPVVGQLLGVGGIVFGVLALRHARTGGHGTGRAITGIVLGAIGTATSTFFLVMVIAANGHTS